jgi:hypothetical protein
MCSLIRVAISSWVPQVLFVRQVCEHWSVQAGAPLAEARRGRRRRRRGVVRDVKRIFSVWCLCGGLWEGGGARKEG